MCREDAPPKSLWWVGVKTWILVLNFRPKHNKNTNLYLTDKGEGGVQGLQRTAANNLKQRKQIKGF